MHGYKNYRDYQSGDTRQIKEWLEQQIGSMSDRKNDLVDIKREILILRQTVDAMHKKIDSIEHILEKVSG